MVSVRNSETCFLGSVPTQLWSQHHLIIARVRVGIWLVLYRTSYSTLQTAWLSSNVLYVTTLVVAPTVLGYICFSFRIICFQWMPNARRAKHPGANKTGWARSATSTADMSHDHVNSLGRCVRNTMTRQTYIYDFKQIHAN